MKHSKKLYLRLTMCVAAVLMTVVFPFHANAANWVSPLNAYDSDIGTLDLAMNNDPPEKVLLRIYTFEDGGGKTWQPDAKVKEIVIEEGGSADIGFTVGYDGGRVESDITITYNDKDTYASFPYRMFTFYHDTNQYYDESVSGGGGSYHDFGSEVALYRPQGGMPCLMFSIGGMNCLYMEIAGVQGLAGGYTGNDPSDDYGRDSEGIAIAIVIAVAGGGIAVITLVIGKKVKASKPKPVYTPSEKDVIITDPATGAQTRYVQDPRTGEWVDPVYGSVLDPDKLPEWIRQRKDDRKWVDEQNRKLQTGDNAFDRKLAEDAAKQKTKDSVIDEMLRISQRTGTLPQSEVNNNIRKNVRKLVDKLIEGEEVSPDAIDRVRGAFVKSATNTIISQSELPKVPSDLSLFGNAFVNEVEEVSRNQTASAVFFRTIFAISTFGGSEIFFQSHKGYLRMRDYVDEGGDSVVGGGLTAAWGAIKDFIVSKTADKIMGKVPAIKNLNKSNGGKIVYNQIKRFVKGDINSTDKNILDIDGKIRNAIKRKFN